MLVDPETGMTFEEMRLVQEIREVSPGVVEVNFRPSSPICPMALKLAMDIKKAVLEIDGVSEARVRCIGHRMQETIDALVNRGDQE
jgi:metal-sulfur cluster biosynthetic enzyme